jgi:hypothetical protein
MQIIHGNAPNGMTKMDSDPRKAWGNQGTISTAKAIVRHSIDSLSIHPNPCSLILPTREVDAAYSSFHKLSYRPNMNLFAEDIRKERQSIALCEETQMCVVI